MRITKRGGWWHERKTWSVPDYAQAISNLDQQTAEHFVQTINRLKGKVTMIFITHQVPKGLQVDEVVNMGQHAMQMSLVKDEM